MLVASLSEIEGTMLFVSHDRTFLKGLSTKVLELLPGDEAGPDGIVRAEPPPRFTRVHTTNLWPALVVRRRGFMGKVEQS